MPIVVIAGILYLTISLINGKEILTASFINNTTSFINSGETQFKQTKNFLASIFTGFRVFITNSTIQKNETSSSAITTPTSTTTSTQTSTIQKNETSSSAITIPTPAPASTSPIFTGKNQTKIYPSGGFIPPTPASPPDLSLQIVDTGILNGDVFTYATSVQLGQKAAVVFDVRNIGGNVSPEWNFSAEIPTLSPNFISETQSALAPGEGIRFTIGFNDIKGSGTNTVSFVVDSSKIVSNDPNRTNNTASTTLFRNY